MSVIKVLIADDSVVYRSQIKGAFADIAGTEVVGTSSNGRLALQRLQQGHVDLLILDLEMPELDGLGTLRELVQLQQKISCKVLVFSSQSKRGAEITLEALRLGASEFVTKPSALVSLDETDSKNLTPSQKIKNILEPKVRALFPQLQSAEVSPGKTLTHQNSYVRVIWDLFTPEMVVIGSSTGGPTVLEKIFSDIAPPLRCPVLIAQHMPPVFTASLAERLAKLSGIAVVEASHETPIIANTVYIAPGDFHLRLGGASSEPKMFLDQGPLIHSVRPAVDPLFESAAAIFKNKCLGIVLTGMGADGKVGAERIKEFGGAVIIQDESSCVVFGMPGAVQSSGAYDKIMTPTEIARFLQEKVATERMENVSNSHR